MAMFNNQMVVMDGPRAMSDESDDLADRKLTSSGW